MINVETYRKVSILTEFDIQYMFSMKKTKSLLMFRRIRHAIESHLIHSKLTDALWHHWS
jgi:hypothetical protein